jgi:hypothetical protein
MKGEKSGGDAGFYWLKRRRGVGMGKNGKKSGHNRHFYR